MTGYLAQERSCRPISKLLANDSAVLRNREETSVRRSISPTTCRSHALRYVGLASIGESRY